MCLLVCGSCMWRCGCRFDDDKFFCSAVPLCAESPILEVVPSSVGTGPRVCVASPGVSKSATHTHMLLRSPSPRAHARTAHTAIRCRYPVVAKQ